MFTENEIMEIINQKIRSDVKLGEQAGGSGHLGYKSYLIDYYAAKQISDELMEIKYKYTVITETEFTYYPDNLPYEDHFKKTIVVNDKKVIVSED